MLPICTIVLSIICPEVFLTQKGWPGYGLPKSKSSYKFEAEEFDNLIRLLITGD